MNDAFEVVVTDGNHDAVETYRFESPFVLIGRSAACDLPLDDPRVSSRHAYLQQLCGRLICVDLASSNGTFWPEGRKPFGWFDEHNPIEIGKYHLHLVSRNHEEKIAAPEFDPGSFFKSVTDEPDFPQVSLQVLSESGGNEAWTLSRTITLVGSNPCCKLRLSHESVSRVHCSLVLMPEGLWIFDLLGNAGTFVNDEKVRAKRLATDDVFSVGKYSFRVKYLNHQTVVRSIEQIDKSGTVISNEFASHMIDQMMAMQKQFLEQSQKQTEMMLQFFSTLHTQQHELLKQEMARVHEIDKELRDLRAALTATSRASSSDPPNSSSKQAGSAQTSTSRQPKRLPHVRYVGAPRKRPDQTERSDAEPSEACSGLDDADTVAESDAEPSRPLQTKPGKKTPIDSASRDASVQELNQEATEPDEADRELPEEMSANHSAASAEDRFQEISNPDKWPQDTKPTQNGVVDHHAWVLSRMHQLERERDSIFRRMVNSIFKSNQ